MAQTEEPLVPIWTEAKARKKIDIVKEVAKALAEAESTRANQPIAKMTERDLEAEQLRLGEMLHDGTMTVADFQRLREIDFYLREMRERRHHASIPEGWKPESLGD